MTHDELKQQYLRYRERARELYEEAAVLHEPHYVHRSITVSLNANVQMCEDGAFVEAVVWVPRDKL